MIEYKISIHELSKILCLNQTNNEAFYKGISTLDNPESNTILFIKKIDEDVIGAVSKLKDCLIITEDRSYKDSKTVLVENTRYSMAKVLSFIYNNKNVRREYIASSAVVSSDAKIGENVMIEDFVYIGPNVSIGNNTWIKQGVKIIENCTIGDNCIIRENSVISGQGFGVEKDMDMNNYKIAHIGGVLIHDNVEIGALNTVVTGTIDPTIIESYVKTDDHVHIAHNCHIMRNTCITAGVILSGSVKIGRYSYIGPNSTIRNSVSVQENNFIGIGTVVTKSIKDSNNVYAGNPAEIFDELKKDRTNLKYLSDNINKIKELL